MPYQPIVPEGSPPPLAPYSPGAKAGNVLYVCGVLPRNAANQSWYLSK
jgi:aminoacrylate peracid reductase